LRTPAFVFASRALSALAEERRQRDRREDGDDEDHDQQLDHGESAFVHSRRHRPLQADLECHFRAIE